MMESNFDFSKMSDFDLVIMQGQCRKQTPVEDADFIKAIGLELSKRQNRVAVTSDNKPHYDH